MLDFLSYHFFYLALVASLFLGVASGFLSPLVVARKHAFMGSALSHSTLLGVAIGLVFIELTAMNYYLQDFVLFFITLAITLGCVAVLAWTTWKFSGPSDALIGIFLAATMGASVIVHQLFVQTGADLMGFLFGQIILISGADIWLVIISSLLIASIMLLYWREWQIMSFDPQGAQLLGLPVASFHFLFYFLMTLFVVAGVKISGTILINSLLLAPGLFALRRAGELKTAYLYAIFFSCFSALIGLVLATLFNLPPGATMACVQCLLLIMDKHFIKVNNA